MVMVSNITNLIRSGLSNWLIQRVSALILGAYTVCIIGNFIMHPQMDYQTWVGIFENNVMRIFSTLTLLSLSAHAWIGMWTVFTDYLTPLQLGTRATAVRLGFQSGCLLLISVYVVWGIQILWGS